MTYDQLKKNAKYTIEALESSVLKEILRVNPDGELYSGWDYANDKVVITVDVHMRIYMEDREQGFDIAGIATELYGMEYVYDSMETIFDGERFRIKLRIDARQALSTEEKEFLRSLGKLTKHSYTIDTIACEI